MSSSPTPEQFRDASWADILPYYEELASASLDTANAAEWMERWSLLDRAVVEAENLAEIAYTVDTGSEEKEAAYLRFSGEIMPRREEQGVQLASRLLDLGYSRDDLEQVIRRFQNQRDLYRAENVPLQEELQELNARYHAVTGGMTAEWEGEELPLPRLSPFLLVTDRDTRERAFRKQAQPYVEARDEIADIFDEQYTLRQQVARNAGFDNYRDYIFKEKHRFDYTPADCEAFHDAVATHVVPALARRYERRREQLGYDVLRPWDLGVDPLGRPPLKPFETAEQLIAGGQAIFRQVDPIFGDYFDTMDQEGLLDLDSRAGKAPGGYCTSLDYRRRPFIFMNSAGVPSDVTTLLHEAGHAFHVFETTTAQPLIFQWSIGSEMDEVASMAMELLAAPYLTTEHGGYYSEDDGRRARIEHLESILWVLTWIAPVDAFQHWLYTSGIGDDREARDDAWLQIFARFNAGVDWDGLTQQLLARWYRQLHIFLYPFYYIEYGIAQLGALQVWRNSLSDQQAAITSYRQALALGGTRSLPELYAAAGARFAFDDATVAELTTLIEEQLAAIEG